MHVCLIASDTFLGAHSDYENYSLKNHLIKIIYPRGKGPTQELYSSSRRTAVVPLFKNYMQLFFLVSFLGWVMLLHPQATSTFENYLNILCSAYQNCSKFR